MNYNNVYSSQYFGINVFSNIYKYQHLYSYKWYKVEARNSVDIPMIRNCISDIRSVEDKRGIMEEHSELIQWRVIHSFASVGCE